MTEAELKPYVKRLETVQNMTDVSGVKELCEILMDLLEEMKSKSKKFGFTQEDK